MNPQDLFVCCAAVGVGVCLLCSAVSDQGWSAQLATSQWIEARYGRGAARLYYVLVGLAMIGIGLQIAWSATRSPRRHPAGSPSGGRLICRG